jgi:hypothetical protein
MADNIGQSTDTVANDPANQDLAAAGYGQGATGVPDGYDQGIPKVDGSMEGGNPTAAGYFSTRTAWDKNIVGMVGKLGPTAAGPATGGLITNAVTEKTTVKGAASYSNYTLGTRSTSNFTLGSLSDSDFTVGARGITRATAGMMTDFNLCLGLTSSIKLAIKASEFNIAVLNADHTTFAATSLHNDLTARVINQAPSVVANLLSITWGIVAENKIHVNKNHLASMHTFASLMHMLF